MQPRRIFTRVRSGRPGAARVPVQIADLLTDETYDGRLRDALSAPAIERFWQCHFWSRARSWADWLWYTTRPARLPTRQ